MRTSISSALRVASVLCCTALTVSLATAQESVVRSALQEQTASSKDSVRAQAQIDRMSNETAELLADYRVATQSLDRVRIYNQHLQTIVNDQEQVKAQINEQLENFGQVEQEIIPLMQRMIAELEQFIRLDVPFLPDERSERVANLKSLMDDSNVSISEKYRRIMDSYKIEADFGRTIEAYSGWLDANGERRQVDFLRVGRVFLGYQTQDRSDTGFWDKSSGQWAPLGEDYRKFVAEGLRVARKQKAPELLQLPVTAPEAAR